MRHILSITACCLVAGAAASGLAAEPTAAQLQAWLAQLDDDTFARREEATARLHAAGDAAIEALATGTLSGSPEVAWRAGEALKRIAIDGNERTLDRVAAALARAGKQHSGGMHALIAEIRTRQRQMRHDRAAAQIRQLGGNLSGGSVMFGGEGMIGLAMPLPAVDFVKVAAAIEAPAAEAPADEPAAVEAAAEVPAEVADEVARVEDAALERVEDAALELLDELPPPATDDLKAVIAEFFAADPAPRAAIEIEPLAVDIGFVEIAGGGLFGAEIELAGGGSAESLVLDANWRGGDKGLSVLGDLPEITQVSIHGARLTDAAIGHLAALPGLRNLHIRGTKFSAAALRKLHRARPQAYMFCQGDAMVGIHADTSGACVLTSVYPGSGAHEAGLRAGDKVVAIDGLDIRDFSELTISVYARGVGEKLKVEYERDGQRHTAHVQLKARKVLEP